MRAVVQTGYGSPDVLELQHVDKPVPAGDEVLVRVRAAAVNAGDCFMMEGRPLPVRLILGWRRPRNNRIVGWDLAGTVEAVGEHVTALRPGDDVYGACGIESGGAFAEYACVTPGRLARKPKDLTYEQAAATPVAAVTALRGLRDQGRVLPGHKVLVNGASGGVGHFAVQIARALGAEVTGVCSTTNLGLVRSLGAGHAVDYTQTDFTQGEERYDLILDNIGTHPFSHYRRVLSGKGLVVPNTGHAGLGYVLKAFALSRFSRRQGRMFSGSPDSEDLVFLKDLVEAGKVTPVVDRTYPLEDAPAAVGYVAEGHARGKVVIVVGPDASAAEAPAEVAVAEQPVARSGATPPGEVPEQEHGSEAVRGRPRRFWEDLVPGLDGRSQDLDDNTGAALTLARPYVGPGDTVLDVGCATGHAALRLAADVRKVVGVDSSSDMVAMAERRAARLGIKNASFIQATIWDEVLQPGSFGGILAFNILHLLEDLEESLVRMSRLLKPGGVLVAMTPCLGEGGTWARRGLRTGIRLLGLVGLIPHVGTYTVLGLQDALETAGLCPVEIVELGHGSGQHFIAARKPVVPLGSRAEAGRRPDFVSIMGSKSESGSMVIDRRQMMGYFNMLAAIPGFFLSSLFFMLLWGPISSRLGVSDIDYKTAMLIMITLWIAVAPLAAAGRSKSKKM